MEDERVARHIEAPWGTRARGDHARRSLQLIRRDDRANVAAPARPHPAPPHRARAPAPPRAWRPATAPTVPTADVQLQGAGATFPAPLYTTWFETYNGKNSNIKIDYQAIGSGGGIKGITEQTVDFGASDAAMKDDEIAKLPPGTKIVHVPTALGAVVVIYNLPGVNERQPRRRQRRRHLPRRRSRTGTTRRSPRTTRGATLPDKAILVVHRSDGSGTTNAFTTYLDTVSPDWHAKVGAGKEVNWPTGIGAQGNDGVAGGVKQTPGAVGYVELNYATQAKPAVGQASRTPTASSSPAPPTASPPPPRPRWPNFPADFRQAPIINGAGDDDLPDRRPTPTSSSTVDQTDADKGKAIVVFTYWALTDGQAAEPTLGYAPLPAEIQQKAIDELHTFTTGGSPIWP